jgi:hypothetical protein
MRQPRLFGLGVLAVAASFSLSCTTTGAIVGTTVGATVVGGFSPTQEIEQIYYLGVFDPREQVPEAVYRVTVKGQASFISLMKFGSGWVPAGVIDSLGGQVYMAPQAGAAGPSITAADPATRAELKVGRRLVLFGPEGFREAPAGHRLVIVMGSSPEEFFRAIDTALGEIAQVQVERDNSGIQKEIFQALLEVKTDQQSLKDIEVGIVRDFK